MYSCPICGKDSNRRGRPFDTPEQVVGHVDGSHDENHRDVSGADIRDEIDATGDDSEQPAPGREGGAVGQEDEYPSDLPANPSNDRQDAARAPEAEGGATTVEMPADEFDEAVRTVASEARSEGYEEGVEDGFDAGYGTAEHELEVEPADVESTVHDTQVGEEQCPVCQHSTAPMPEGDTLQTTDGNWIETESGDRYCESCHAITDGKSHHALSRDPKPHKGGGSVFGKVALLIGAGVAALIGMAVKNGRGQGGEHSEVFR